MADDVLLYRDANDLRLGGFADRRTFRFVRDYPHGAERVWGALTGAEQLSQWLWPCSSFEPRLGGVGVFNPGKPLTLRVTEFDPPRRLALSDRIYFMLEPLGDGCRLTLDLKRPDDGWSPMALAGFHGWVGRLSRLLARRPQDEIETWALGIWNAVAAHCEWEVRRWVSDGERVIWRLHFPEHAAELTPEAAEQLGELARLLVARNLGVTLDGFGDDACGEDAALRLCGERVRAVSRGLEALGVPAERVNVGFVLGNYHYLAERDCEAGRAYNRRIELRPQYA
jgi:uncharacterized protein YndB with AHSA1/START domain